MVLFPGTVQPQVIVGAAYQIRTPAPVEGINDADLVGHVLDGKGWAYDALYQRHAKAIGGMVARLLGTRQDVDDVVHDAFVAAFEKIHTLRDPNAFRSWLTQIAIARVRQILRRQRLGGMLGLRFPTDDATLKALASSELDPERRLELGQLDEVLHTLPIGQRIAWMLRHVEGHTIDDVARHCDCSPTTVKRWLRKAERRVKQVFARNAWEDGRG